MSINSNIQALRAFAAISVLIFHTLPHYQAMNGKSTLLHSIFSFGFAGVDLFFVISGYVIAMTTVDYLPNLLNGLRFIERRAFRIYFGYWPFLLLAYLFQTSIDSPRAESWSVIKSFFLLSPNMNELVLGVAWSLTYELYFYTLFFFLILLGGKKRKFLLIAYFLVIIVVNVTVGYQTLKLMVHPFVLEFISGCFLYYFFKRYNKMILLIPFGIMIVTLIYIAVDENARNGLWRVGTFGTASFLLVWSAIILHDNGIRSLNILSKLGDASYTIYLSHTVFLTFFYLSGLRSYLVKNGSLFVEVGFFSYIIFILIVSYFIYLFVEKPVYLQACSYKRIRPSSYLGTSIK